MKTINNRILIVDDEESVQKNIELQSNALQVVKLEKDAAKVTQLAVNRFEAQLLNTKNLQYDIQQKIVAECQAIDTKVESAKAKIEKAKKVINDGYIQLSEKATTKLKLNDENLFDISIGSRVLAKEVSQDEQKGIPVYSANVFTPFGYINKQLLNNFDSPYVLWGIDGDWMVNIIEKNKAFYPTDHCGTVRIKTNKVHHKYFAWIFNKIGTEMRFSRSNRASTERIKNLSIQVPPIEIQETIIAEIEVLEQTINENQTIINNAAMQKQAIIQKYL